jgi:hypothetical protein
MVTAYGLSAWSPKCRQKKHHSPSRPHRRSERGRSSGLGDANRSKARGVSRTLILGLVVPVGASHPQSTNQITGSTFSGTTRSGAWRTVVGNGGSSTGRTVPACADDGREHQCCARSGLGQHRN